MDKLSSADDRYIALESLLLSRFFEVLHKLKNYMIDIDGVVCTHIENERSDLMSEAEEIRGAKTWINSHYDSGDHICFFTARLEEHREITETWLKSHGFKYHKIIFGKPRGGNYHYIDDKRVQATTFNGKFSPLIRKSIGIEVFE